MKLIKKILNKFNGLHYPQEYLCFAKESFSQPLHFYIVNEKLIVKDITNEHLFVGYSPLIFALSSFTEASPALPGRLHIICSQQSLQPNEVFSKKDAIASLQLKMIREQLTGNKCIFYYEGTNGSHHFLSAFHQFINGLNNRLFNKRPGNIFLHDNLYRQVQIAYAIPRIISLITIQIGDGFNLFPTDLNGEIDEEYYIISLRHGGRACEQVEKAGKLVISQVNSEAYKIAFALGKNHMQELKSKDHFPFGSLLSANLHWPLPEHTRSYRELVLVDSFTHGIHKLILFKILAQQQVQPVKATLAHIHNSYATWRFKKRLPGNYLLR